MTSFGRALAGVAMLLAVQGCVPAPPFPAPAPPPAPQPQAAERATEPPEPATFSFEGALRQGGVAIGTAPRGTIKLTLEGAPLPLSPDGRFMIGFDRDAGPTARLEATLRDGAVVAEVLSPEPREWSIERVNVALRPNVPSAEFQRLRAIEIARIGAARKIVSTTAGWEQHFMWPATGRISGVFGSQRIYRGQPGAYHTGVDVAQPTGTPIVAPADGVVILAAEKPLTLEGNLLMIDHGMGLNSAFLHLSRIDVRQGERVRRGQAIGAIGATGRVTGPHLHWSMMWRGARIDPALLAGPMS